MARYVIYGAGAVGGVVGGRLFANGEEVILIARGEHHDAIARDGLRIDSPAGTTVLEIPVVAHPSEIELRADDVVVLTMKSQDTAPALEALATLAPPSIAVVCAQNGVANEAQALRRFENVYGMCVVCATSYLSPGRVFAHKAPLTGIFDLGRYPNGIDDVAASIAEAFTPATLRVELRADVMVWKYTKLLRNLPTVLQALVGPEVQAPEVTAALRAEGLACFAAAGIETVGPDEWTDERQAIVGFSAIEGFDTVAGSTWQSLVRGTGSIETDFLNGEIVLLGRLHGVPTPVNVAVAALARRLSAQHAAPGEFSESALLAAVGLG